MVALFYSMMISRSTSSILKLTSPEVKEQMYGSFRTKLYEANQEANDCLDYLNRIRRMIRSSDIFTVTLVIVLLLPLSMIFVGEYKTPFTILLLSYSLLVQFSD
ncbi:uncharacterized protein LOC118762036 [Octopus sinensis]|uniref:Uncharacterized protein LOC118762036 n=1 Tax=Octopus sinensis TaxID=2607531 RepID=A0A7E6EMY2_9MOLL|nr:uncharacterized protein LOC118762036 [Octopus sinensis]